MLETHNRKMDLGFLQALERDVHPNPAIKIPGASVTLLEGERQPEVSFLRTPTGGMTRRNSEKTEYTVILKILKSDGSSEVTPIGPASLLYNTFGDLEKCDPRLFEAASGLGLKKEDKVAQIDRFRPFDDAPAKIASDIKKKGIGTEVLTQLLKRLREEGVPVVFGATLEELMQHLFEKIGFQKIREDVQASKGGKTCKTYALDLRQKPEIFISNQS